MKKEPAFLTTSEIIKYHQLLTRQFGGENGVRSHDLLESAIAMPSATFDGRYLHPTIPDMAAAYLYHLVKNHPFVDGNKRVGTMAAILFLSLNNYYLDATDEEFTKLVLQVAAGEKTLRGISFFFHRHAHPKHSRKRNI